MVGWKYGFVWFFSGNPARFDGLTRCFISGNPPGHRSPKKTWFIIIFPNKLVVGGGKSSICRRTPYEQPLGFTKDACQTTLKGLYSWKHVRLVKGWSCLKQVNHRTTSSNQQIYWEWCAFQIQGSVTNGLALSADSLVPTSQCDRPLVSAEVAVAGAPCLLEPQGICRCWWWCLFAKAFWSPSRHHLGPHKLKVKHWAFRGQCGVPSVSEIRWIETCGSNDMF